VAFREYKIGARMFGVALGGSMMITLYFPTKDITSVAATEVGLRKALAFGHQSGFSYEDPMVIGEGKPKTVVLRHDPDSGKEIEPVTVYVYEKGIPFPSAVTFPRTEGPRVKDLSVKYGRITEASEDQGAVFSIQHGDVDNETLSYVEDVTATRGWTPQKVLGAVQDADISYIGSGKSMFIREGCWWCHTLLPEQTQDWQVFGVPPRLGDFNSESPTSFGSDRKAPDLLHVGSRNSSREWLMMHFFNPRLVQPHSIMPRFDYLWGDVDAKGQKIDYAAWREQYNEYARGERIYPPDVPEPAPNSRIRRLLDFILSLK
jgi:cytochrome c oxidase cbb3-type subunit II